MKAGALEAECSALRAAVEEAEAACRDLQSCLSAAEVQPPLPFEKKNHLEVSDSGWGRAITNGMHTHSWGMSYIVIYMDNAERCLGPCKICNMS